jgi:hypothetical protein
MEVLESCNILVYIFERKPLLRGNSSIYEDKIKRQLTCYSAVCIRLVTTWSSDGLL